MILEEAPDAESARRRCGAARLSPPAGRLLGARRMPWLVSARSAAGLAAQAGRLAAHLAAASGPGPRLTSAWSLATTRSAFEHRAVVIGATGKNWLAGLAAVAAGEPAAGAVAGTVPPDRTDADGVRFPRTGCSVGGDGPRAGCGVAGVRGPAGRVRGRRSPPTSTGTCTEVLAGADGAPGLERADVVQPALWAVMVSLAAVWQAAGVVPDAVAGHSQGEIAAARCGWDPVLAGRGEGHSAAQPGAGRAGGPGRDGVGR